MAIVSSTQSRRIGSPANGLGDAIRTHRRDASIPSFTGWALTDAECRCATTIEYHRPHSARGKGAARVSGVHHAVLEV